MNTQPKINIANLERCAVAAQESHPSPWNTVELLTAPPQPAGVVDAANGVSVAFVDREDDPHLANHIAAADPATVLALVRVVRAALVLNAGRLLYGDSVGAEFNAALEAFRP